MSNSCVSEMSTLRLHFHQNTSEFFEKKTIFMIISLLCDAAMLTLAKFESTVFGIPIYTPIIACKDWNIKKDACFIPLCSYLLRYLKF